MKISSSLRKKLFHMKLHDRRDLIIPLIDYFQEQQDMFSVLAGILSLGNTEFEANDDGGATPIKNSTYVNNAAVSIVGMSRYNNY